MGEVIPAPFMDKLLCGDIIAIASYLWRISSKAKILIRPCQEIHIVNQLK